MENKPVIENRQRKNMSYDRLESALGTTGKLTPQAVEFEEAVLGAIMLDDNALSSVVDFMDPKMFYVEANQYIYDSIIKLYTLSQPVDLLTVTNQLRKDKLLDVVGGASYLAALTNRVSSAANVEYHARVVMEKFVLREMISNCTSIINDAYDDSQDVVKLMDEAETKIFNIIENNFKRDSKPLNQVVKSALQELEALRDSDGDNIQGVGSGIRVIDAVTGGWQKSDLIILAARPGMGKTSFVLSIARNAALQYNKPVAFFSLEMSANQLVHRLFAIESGVPADRIAKGSLNENEWIRLMDSIGSLESSNLIIDDTPALSVFDLRAKCRRLKHKYDIQMVIVDYLQLMQANVDAGKGGNREQEISYISRSLKALAKDLEIPVIALSQLSREVEKRGDRRRPQLSDLRESGSIEQDADMVLFIYRPEYYHFDTFEDDKPSAGLAEIMFEKNRHGSTGNVRIRFQAQYTKFSDVESTEDDGIGAASASAGIQPNENFSIIDAGFNNDEGPVQSEPTYNDDVPF